jgi:hypothetical protein
MAKREWVFSPGHRMFQVRGKKAHWVPKGSRASPCGQLDLDFHKAKKVATLAGFIPHDTCGLCKKALERET